MKHLIIAIAVLVSTCIYPVKNGIVPIKSHFMKPFSASSRAHCPLSRAESINLGNQYMKKAHDVNRRAAEREIKRMMPPELSPLKKAYHVKRYLA